MHLIPVIPLTIHRKDYLFKKNEKLHLKNKREIVEC